MAGCGRCIALELVSLLPGEMSISASNRNFKGKLDSTDVKAYLASCEVVAASALQGHIAGPGWYKKPDGIEKVIISENSGDLEADNAMSIEDALDKTIAEAESVIFGAEKYFTGSDKDASSGPEEPETVTEILAGFPEKD